MIQVQIIMAEIVQALPVIIMFAATIVVCALFALPMRLWSPKDSVGRVYWRGVWMFLIAITSVSGAMNTLTLAGIDVVAPTEVALQILLAAFVGFVMFGWFQMVGIGTLRLLRKVAGRKVAATA